VRPEVEVGAGPENEVEEAAGSVVLDNNVDETAN
jgi:hypothetical protein